MLSKEAEKALIGTYLSCVSLNAEIELVEAGYFDSSHQLTDEGVDYFKDKRIVIVELPDNLRDMENVEPLDDYAGAFRRVLDAYIGGQIGYVKLSDKKPKYTGRKVDVFYNDEG